MATMPGIWQSVREWGGWLFGGVTALLAVGKAADARIDARFAALMNDPDTVLNRTLSGLRESIEQLLKDVARQGAVDERVDDVHKRIDGIERRLNIGDRRGSSMAGSTEPFLHARKD